MALSLRRKDVPAATGQEAPRTRPRVVKLSQRAPATRWYRKPRTVYTLLVVAGFSAFVLGLAVVAVWAALIVGGLAVAALGLVGLGMQVRGVIR